MTGVSVSVKRKIEGRTKKKAEGVLWSRKEWRRPYMAERKRKERNVVVVEVDN